MNGSGSGAGVGSLRGTGLLMGSDTFSSLPGPMSTLVSLLLIVGFRLAGVWVEKLDRNVVLAQRLDQAPHQVWDVDDAGIRKLRAVAFAAVHDVPPDADETDHTHVVVAV